MIIAIVSDLHLLHWHNQGRLSWLLKSIQESFDRVNPDLIIDAGDIESEFIWERWFKSYKRFSILGNHDFYGKKWKNPNVGCHYEEFDGIRIAGTTLWTDFNNNDLIAHINVGRGLIDFHKIKNFTTEICYETHLVQRKFLEDIINDRGVDIVVTHHCPSYKCVAPQYADSPLNPGFVSELDWLVEKSEAKYWICGHTHIPCNIRIGKTQVIINPAGYPFERQNLYNPVYISI